MECYHHKLKLAVLNKNSTSVYERTDWLVDKLYTKVHSCFFLEIYPGKEVFTPYMKGKLISGPPSWRRALEIPDSDVVLENNSSAKVISQTVRDKAHLVWNPGSEFALCDCSWSCKGNLCKHVIKVNHICRRNRSSEPSITLFKYHQILTNMLHCPAHDSLNRDHAASLAVRVRDALEKSGISDSAAGVLDTEIEREYSMEQMPMPIESASGIQDEAHVSGVAGLNNEKTIDQEATDTGFCGETAEQSLGFSDMDVDPVLMCISPSEYLPSDGIFSTGDSLGKEDSQSTKVGFGSSGSFSLNNDSFVIGDRIQDYISDREFRADMISKGVRVDVLDGTLPGSMMDIDPRPIQLPMMRCEIH